jgi:transcriptional regulator with PAS, ATPase and Fis domain
LNAYAAEDSGTAIQVCLGKSAAYMLVQVEVPLIMNYEKGTASSDICIIAPSEQLANNSRRIIESFGLSDIQVFLSTVDEVDEVYQRATAAGGKIFISRRGVAKYLKAKYRATVIDMEITIEDYVKMFEAAVGCHGLVAFFTFEEVSLDIKAICRALKIEIRPYLYQDNKDCEACVRQAISDGAKMGIGGSVTEKYARALGLPHLSVENSDEAIIRAIQRAMNMLDLHRKEEQKQVDLKMQLEKYIAVFDFSHDAIIVTDKNCIVQSINPKASRMSGISRTGGVGKPLNLPISGEIRETIASGKPTLNKVVKIDGAISLMNVIPIVVDHVVMGAVSTLQDGSTIQSNEKKIRLSLTQKGLVAKYRFDDILGESAAIRSTVEIAKSYAREKAAVLLRGETGVGKELFAQSIHNFSDRRDGPFVAVNCAAIPQNLLESELFGYESGAFTGAVKGGKMGLFELAHGGTIFLDEIGEIPKETQVTLLRVLQEKEVRRIGSGEVIPVDIRIITATNKDLEDDVRENRFRKDLYFRLSVLNVKIPPLRERQGDIPYLGHRFLKELSGGAYESYAALFDRIIHMDVMKSYPWYGNIRELQNFVERFYILMKNGYNFSEDSRIWKGLLLDEKLSAPAAPCPAADLPPQPDGGGSNPERDKILKALEKNDFIIAQAAGSLGISRQTLWRKMKKHGIDWKHIAPGA